MPKLLNQLNHRESKLNSELQFRNQKKRKAERAKEESPTKSRRAAKISQCCKFL